MASAAETEAYLRRLGACLSVLNPEERMEIVAEVRAHFDERLAQGRAPLEGFEAPEVYAMGFVEETRLAQAVVEGGSVRLGSALLSSVRDAGETLLVVVPLLLAQLLAAALLVLGVLKPFFFANIGVFAEPFRVGFVSQPGRELLGFWAVPLFVVPSALVLYGANRAMRWLARRRLDRRRARG